MTRLRTALLLIASAILLVTFFGACHYLGVAHAQAEATPPAVPPASTGLPLEAWIALILAAVGSIRGIVRGAADLMALISKQTRNTVDDGIASKLDRVADTLDEINARLPGGGSGTSLNVVRKPQGGSALVVVMLGLAIAGLATLSTGCAPSVRESTLKAALITTDASREAFLAYDQSRQAEIVAKATTLDEGKAKLASYRSSRSKVETAIAVVYRAIAVAATLNDDQSITALQQALADAVAIINEFTRNKP